MSDAAVQTHPVTDTDSLRAAVSMTRQRRPIRLQQSLSAVSADLRQKTAAISDQVADDIVHWSVGHGAANPADEHVKTMRLMVDELLDKHSSLFRGLMTRFNASPSDVPASITAVADEEFGDGEANWGRITALCAFVARMARYFQEKNMGDNAEALSDALRAYFSNHLNDWIATQGGWEKFTRRFQPQQSLEPKIFKGMLATGLVLGVIAGVVALR